MSQFIISCKESRIENNRSFYGCFYLGPFEPSQSITIANTLRRTLLSEIYGLAIVSVEIEGASHEYSSLPGVHESVLDILLNIKEIVLKKTIKNFSPQIGYLRTRGPGVVTASHLRLPPFIQCVDPDQYIATLSHNGFLNIKFIIQYGNKWLMAGTNRDLSINPLSHISNTNQEVKDDFSLKGGASNFTKSFKNVKSLTESQRPKMVDSKHSFIKHPIDSQSTSIKNAVGNNIFNLYFKKRRLFLKKLKNFGVSGSNSYIKMFSPYKMGPFRAKNLNELLQYKQKRDLILKAKNKESLKLILKIRKKYPGINLKNSTYSITKSEGIHTIKPFGHRKQKLLTKTKISSLKKPILPSEKSRWPKIESDFTLASQEQSTLDFSKKVLSYSKNAHFKSAPSAKSHLPQNGDNYFIPTMNSNTSHNNSDHHKKKGVFTKHAALNSLNIDAIFNPITKVNYIIETNDFKIAQNKLQTSFNTSELYDTLAGLWPQPHKKNLEPFKKGRGRSEIGPKGQYNNVYDRIGIDIQNESISPIGEKTLYRKTPIQQNLSINLLTASNKYELTNLLQLNHELSALTKETIKHNIILEIWTNGSMHPRDALNQALKNLIKIFVKLKNIQPFGGNNLSLNKNSFISASKLNVDLCLPIGQTHQQKQFQMKENKQITKIDQILVKKIKMGVLRKDFLEKIEPLNETTFLSTYISPNIKSYYLNRTNLLQILNFYAVGKNNKLSPIFIARRFTSEFLS